jgi:hypothetical protein
VAERLGELAREQGGTLRERRARLDIVERDIAKLIDFIIESNGTVVPHRRPGFLGLRRTPSPSPSLCSPLPSRPPGTISVGAREVAGEFIDPDLPPDILDVIAWRIGAGIFTDPIERAGKPTFRVVGEPSEPTGYREPSTHQLRVEGTNAAAKAIGLAAFAMRVDEEAELPGEVRRAGS